jgi:hypothetical protein
MFYLTPVACGVIVTITPLYDDDVQRVRREFAFVMPQQHVVPFQE